MQTKIIGTLTLLLLSTAIVAAPADSYDWIRHDSDSLRVRRFRGGYMSVSDPLTTPQRLRAIGMNAVMPKFGGLASPPNATNLKQLHDWGAAAHAAGMHFFPVFNFHGGATEKLLGDRREVTAGGQRMNHTPCPLDALFWRIYVHDRAVDLAGRAKELHIDGAILDPEMYGSDHTMYQGCCYCDDCMREFLRDSGQPIPNPLPEPAARVEWLKQHGLTDKFQQHYIDRVRSFCTEIEQDVHQRDPDFLLGVFHLDDPSPFTRGVAEGLGTAERPVLAFSEITYSSGYTKYIKDQQKTFAAMPAHVLFIPGLWIAQYPTENLAEQIYACARDSAGYWIYTIESLVEDVSRLPGYALREPNERYWAAMQLADGELDKYAANDKYESPLKVRPFESPLPVLVVGDIKPEHLIPVNESKPLSLGPATPPRLRYRNPLYILAKAGEPVEVKVANVQLNPNYHFGTQYAVIAPDGSQLLEGTLKLKQSTLVKWTPAQGGAYVLLAGSSQNGYQLQVMSPQPFAWHATEKQKFCVNGILGKLYFYVPKGVAKFSLFVKAAGQAPGRGGKLAVYSPDGKIAGRLAGDLDTLTEFPITVPDAMQGRIWALTGEDLTNDLTVYFSATTAPWLTTDPTRLLVDEKSLQ